jgi:hypothetical protein
MVELNINPSQEMHSTKFLLISKHQAGKYKVACCLGSRYLNRLSICFCIISQSLHQFPHHSPHVPVLIQHQISLGRNKYIEEIAEKSLQQYFEGDMTMSAVITL